MISMNLETKILTDLPMTNCPWTNNNCESMNHVLQQATEWESRCMLNLILILHNEISHFLKIIFDQSQITR